MSAVLQDYDLKYADYGYGYRVGDWTERRLNGAWVPFGKFSEEDLKGRGYVPVGRIGSLWVYRLKDPRPGFELQEYHRNGLRKILNVPGGWVTVIRQDTYTRMRYQYSQYRVCVVKYDSQERQDVPVLWLTGDEVWTKKEAEDACAILAAAFEEMKK